ncbi:4ff2caa9-4edf-4889-b6ce-1168672d2e15-CDS [Sclerotinia trifoliorum]|uniref:4ff2caa9-4edf-4889-b6ce-1168672d2e15-CDS n=1 Tax=Sclerotinia trifoliorum TaxID=28548 RepID=A0A8H2VM52_9HELO|nr:4ff2caa9-4edf-4889-b6ce-1168672d2e15-CDS [Sclerotinia trifoliorum]
MARLTSLILLTIASLAIASPLNPMLDDMSQDKKHKPKPKPTTTTTTTSPTIVAKNIDGCNVEGTAEAGLTSRIFNTYTLEDIVTCQKHCGEVTACISYSYNVNTTVCTAYNEFMDNLVLSDTSSRIFFSDKYPSDGTNFCYQYA